MNCVRRDKGGPWCSPEYMAAKTGLKLVDCARFLNGPAGSEECGLELTVDQADLVNRTLLTAEAEAEEAKS